MRVLTNAARDIELALRSPYDQPLQLAAYTLADVPAAADWIYGLIIVTNETGGMVPAFSDGTNWRRVTDRAIIA